MAALPLCLLLSPAQDPNPSSQHSAVGADISDWRLKGEGIVCCPCAVPCPCRSNAMSTYGHCEATMYLHIREGHCGKVQLKDVRLVNTSGACSMSYQHLSALYFDQSVSPDQQQAFMKIIASFFSGQDVQFPHVRLAPIHVEESEKGYYSISIPGVLEMIVDRNWGQPEPPFPFIAATDRFSNVLQYAQNVRYKMHDKEANLDFDYSRRQANYRAVELDASQYGSQSMLIQFLDGKGWFNGKQLQLIQAQQLPLPDLPSLKQLAKRLTRPHGTTP